MVISRIPDDFAVSVGCAGEVDSWLGVVVGGATADQAFATSLFISDPFALSFFTDLGLGRSP
jgi:hypothetical protein